MQPPAAQIDHHCPGNLNPRSSGTSERKSLDLRETAPASPPKGRGTSEASGLLVVVAEAPKTGSDHLTGNWPCVIFVMCIKGTYQNMCLYQPIYGHSVDSVA